MQPYFNHRPRRHPKQKANAALHNPQGFSANPSFANSMPPQPQPGLINPQIPIPFNNSNALLSNGQAVPNMQPLMTPALGFMGAPNDLGIFLLQNQVNKFNTLRMLMDQVNQLQGEIFGGSFPNLPQQLNPNMGLLQNPMQNMRNPVMPMPMPAMSQVSSFNATSSSHQVLGNQNPNFFPNPLYGNEQQGNLNQQPTTGANGLKPLPVSSQQVQGNLTGSQQMQNIVMPTVGANGLKPLPVSSQQVQGNLTGSQQLQNIVMPTMGANGLKPFSIAPQQGQGNLTGSQQTQNLVMPTVGANGLKPLPVAAEQMQGNLSASQLGGGFLMPAMGAYGSKPLPVALQHAQGNSSAAQQSHNWQPSTYNRWQGNPSRNGHGKTPNAKWENVPGKSFKNNPRSEQSQSGYQMSEFHRTDNRKRKNAFSNERGRKGRGNERASKSGCTNPANQAMEMKRPRKLLLYTEREIKHWREERRKHYPTKANIAKKQRQKQMRSEAIDNEAELRRKQLKEILAKQAELGVEVAEIPQHYLEDNRQSSSKKGRFRNNHDKRGRYNKRGGSAAQQRSADKDSSNITSNSNRKPTLLEKLLSADIRRDKHRLLQVLRFMVMNSFFKNWPNDPLKFPTVVVEEEGYENEAVEANSSLVEEDASEFRNSTIESFGDSDDDDNRADVGSPDDDKHDALVDPGSGFMKRKLEVDRVEEGEILD